MCLFHFQNAPTPGRTIVMNQPNRIQQAQSNQKIVFVTQRPQTPGTVMHQTQQNSTSQQNTVVKFVSNPNTQHTQKIVQTQQKLVVVGMPTSSPGNLQGANNPGNFMTQSNIQASSSSPSVAQMGQGNQPPISVVPKTTFIQQHKVKQDQIPVVVDDLSHLA